LADRIANVEYGLASGGKFEMYAKEFPDFFAALRGTIDVTKRDKMPCEDAMWNHLARLLKVDIEL
jgi:hypothetical protein